MPPTPLPGLLHDDCGRGGLRVEEARRFDWHQGIVIPLVVIIGVAVAGLSGYCVYAGLTRPDVSLNKKVFEWDTMDVMNPKQLKVRVFDQVPKAMPELAEALSYREEYNKQNAEN
ncbi:hypothetical protein pipiens_003193 [Culex pipiens pipiens]|uniref:Uncharacterized protein n=1 Tax=Culex pipiens pipiens TaxID=38569 RepID=A0ABD1D249_CULPP